jgi:hypothetical protein
VGASQGGKKSLLVEGLYQNNTRGFMDQEKSVRSSICGHWRIVWMELWDDEYINCVVPGYIKMYADGFGEFQFGVVEGSFHVAPPERSSFDSKWEGSNECDEALGEIDGIIEMIDQQEELNGTVSFWDGDESTYKAIRVA